MPPPAYSGTHHHRASWPVRVIPRLPPWRKHRKICKKISQDSHRIIPLVCTRNHPLISHRILRDICQIVRQESHHRDTTRRLKELAHTLVHRSNQILWVLIPMRQNLRRISRRRNRVICHLLVWRTILVGMSQALQAWKMLILLACRRALQDPQGGKIMRSLQHKQMMNTSIRLEWVMRSDLHPAPQCSVIRDRDQVLAHQV